MLKREFVVRAGADAGERLDLFLAEKVRSLARHQIQKLIDRGSVRINGGPSKSSYRLKSGDFLELEYESEETETLLPENIPLNIVYRDDRIIVIDKPTGMVVHPGAGVRRGTLVNALLFHFPDIAATGDPERPGIVHRLDKETSGVMVVALTPEAWRDLLRQFKMREVEKTYLGVVWGHMPDREGRYDWPIGRHPKHRQRLSIKTNSPKRATTFYSVREETESFSLLVIKPITGRTHQIRVHMAAAGHPIVGDGRYGRKDIGRRRVRLFLHAHVLIFTHPATRERVEFMSPVPPEFTEIMTGR